MTVEDCPCGHKWDAETVNQWRMALKELQDNIKAPVAATVQTVCPLCEKVVVVEVKGAP